jgi:hypothetical protein
MPADERPHYRTATDDEIIEYARRHARDTMAGCWYIVELDGVVSSEQPDLARVDFLGRGKYKVTRYCSGDCYENIKI